MQACFGHGGPWRAQGKKSFLCTYHVFLLTKRSRLLSVSTAPYVRIHELEPGFDMIVVLLTALLIRLPIACLAT